MYLNWQKQGYFLSCCLPHTGYCAVILQPICSTISHFPALPGRCQQIPVCAWGLSRGWGVNLHPEPPFYTWWCSGHLYAWFFPCSPPQNTIPGLKSRPGFSISRFSSENVARTFLCSVIEKLKHPLNCWTLKHHPQPLTAKDWDQILNPNLSQDSKKKSPCRVQRSADSAAQFQEPDIFNSKSKHLYRAMEIQARCQWLPPSQKEHSDHQR